MPTSTIIIVNMGRAGLVACHHHTQTFENCSKFTDLHRAAQWAELDGKAAPGARPVGNAITCGYSVSGPFST